MKTALRILLVIVVIFLSILAFRSIMRPEKFRTVYEDRHTEIKNRLITLRTVEAIYKNEHKKYAGDVDTLVDFVKNGKINIIKNVGNIPEGMSEADAFKAGLIKKEIVSVPAVDRILEADPTIEKYIHNFQYIPFTNGKKFQIQTGKIASKTYEIPVYRVEVPLDDILSNMSASITPEDASIFKKMINFIMFKDLSEEKQYRLQYKPMWMGSLTEANTAGSWE
jgi:hypothetical protein